METAEVGGFSRFLGGRGGYSRLSRCRFMRRVDIL